MPFLNASDYNTRCTVDAVYCVGFSLFLLFFFCHLIAAKVKIHHFSLKLNTNSILKWFTRFTNFKITILFDADVDLRYDVQCVWIKCLGFLFQFLQ